MKIYLAANKNKRIRNGNFPIAHQMAASILLAFGAAQHKLMRLAAIYGVVLP
jgi:hypothetical protein